MPLGQYRDGNAPLISFDELRDYNMNGNATNRINSCNQGIYQKTMWVRKESIIHIDSDEFK